jgi:hypothetical protein
MFTDAFVNYLRSRTDAPPEFHLHAAMAALSYAAGSNIWCDGWGRPIYPNLWLIIIAPSGYGKSVPLDMADAIVRKAGLGQGILPGSFSQEALLSELSITRLQPSFCRSSAVSFEAWNESTTRVL